MVDLQKIADFQKVIWSYYREQGRSFDWRHVKDPYKVVVSEVMLQQTQTARVAIKFVEFIRFFPDFNSLALASLKDVLFAWQGLGYNRRGKFLHEIAKKVVNEYNGILPDCPKMLVTFPGIGPNTAGSIVAFAYNKPTIFIETNIRSVFLTFFFSNQTEIHDKQLLPLIEAAIDHASARDWYYALMDYGVMLKKQLPNPSRKSAHHAVQSKFEGSDRQIRGMVLKLLIQKQVSKKDLFLLIDRTPERIERALNQLLDENMIQQKSDFFYI